MCIFCCKDVTYFNPKALEWSFWPWYARDNTFFYAGVIYAFQFKGIVPIIPIDNKIHLTVNPDFVRPQTTLIFIHLPDVLKILNMPLLKATAFLYVFCE